MLGRPDLKVVETHISRVFLGHDLVWKTKKPVDLGFLDFTTPEQRKQACEAEVALNGRLAPGVYLGVVPLCPMDAHGVDSAVFDSEVFDSEVVDWAVVMRRLPEERRADRLLEVGRLSRSDLERIAERLARFHAEARCDEETSRFGDVEVVRRNVEENFQQTRNDIGDYLSPRQADQVESWQLDFLDREAERFQQRAESGRVRDGHGDLRLEHVYLDVPDAESDVLIVDCIEFNERFRFGDVCADLAFLAMDLTSLRRPDLAEALLGFYTREAQDYDLYPLVDFYESYRAFVRAKVASMVAAAPDTDAVTRERKKQEAREHFVLALASGRRQLVPPSLVAVGGWIGAGKSTTAELVSELLAAPVIDADRTRKHLLGVAEDDRLYVKPWTGPYSEEMTRATYAELLRRAELVLRSGRSAVLDASFRLKRHRDDARLLAERLGVSFLFVECRADRDVCRQRLIDRSGGPSDGRLEIFDDFVAGYEALEEADEEAEAGQVLRLDTGRISLDESIERLHDALPSAPASLG